MLNTRRANDQLPFYRAGSDVYYIRDDAPYIPLDFLGTGDNNFSFLEILRKDFKDNMVLSVSRTNIRRYGWQEGGGKIVTPWFHTNTSRLSDSILIRQKDVLMKSLWSSKFECFYYIGVKREVAFEYDLYFAGIKQLPVDAYRIVVDKGIKDQNSLEYRKFLKTIKTIKAQYDVILPIEFKENLIEDIFYKTEPVDYEEEGKKRLLNETITKLKEKENDNRYIQSIREYYHAMESIRDRS